LNCLQDVTHGGYYLVTDGIAKQFPDRIMDFPPDETSLIAMGMGYSQAGLLPVVEIPYAKYLDCGADMFFEAAISNWLSNGQQPNGMIVRLQGFDRGLFGGNFHTHNMLHIPPGVDVVCYSNGHDYAKGFRYLVQQAKHGRMVMSVDSTNLLNLRHVHERDDSWRRYYPADSNDYLTFDDIMTYGDAVNESELAIVSYGNGVVTALQARAELIEKHGWKSISIIDSPLLSAVPAQLKQVLPQCKRVVFADICKEGQSPLAGHVVTLQQEGLLPAHWRCCTAPRTYNPLGSVVTFLNVPDVVQSANALRNVD
jgi:pyruvate/2-oxoglutarate/acetoin dehydrogenase E1 component